jgi:hypothetical protein
MNLNFFRKKKDTPENEIKGYSAALQIATNALNYIKNNPTMSKSNLRSKSEQALNEIEALRDGDV